MLLSVFKPGVGFISVVVPFPIRILLLRRRVHHPRNMPRASQDKFDRGLKLLRDCIAAFPR